MTLQPLVRPRPQSEMPTTAPEIFVRNLAGQLRSSQQLVEDAPYLIADRKQLAQLYKLCGDCRDDIDAYQAALDVLDQGVAILPDVDPEIFVLRAQLGLSLHLISQAQADLDRAKAFNADLASVRDTQSEIDWNLGRYEAAVAAIRQAVRTHPSIYSYARLAQLERDCGRQDQAREAFATAELVFTGTQPYAVAWLNLERAAHALYVGELVQAEWFVEEALDRLPQYLAAQQLLAHVRVQRGDFTGAMVLLEALARDSSNPEHWSDLIRLRRFVGDEAGAEDLVQRAHAAWRVLVDRFPQAMYWHAAEFYLGLGENPALAAALLRQNASLRPNAVSWRALSAAERANGVLVAAAEADHLADEAEARLQRALWA